MGPLVVYEIISENVNLFLAFIIGIGFGFVLESNGFSSSRRLAGMFYGYDTTVLKVFFTAAIVGSLGLLFLGLFKWIDLSSIYINPTYLWSTLGGGVIMGAGFILGGYCPGNSTRWHLSAACLSESSFSPRVISFGKAFTTPILWVLR